MPGDVTAAPDERLKFDQIYFGYRDFMFRIAGKILRNAQDTEDAVHDAFLSIIRNISKISELESPKTRAFIAVITERKAIDILRERRKHSTDPLDDRIFGLPEDGEQDLAGCIAALSPRYREILLLKYVHGYSTQECAEILELSYAAAEKLHQRAKKKLYELCREAEIL